MKRSGGFPGLVLKLGFLSLFTDMSSEMLFPLIPLLVAGMPGGGPFVVGLVEGVAETTASLIKLVSGVWADRTGRRTPFVIAGYCIASIVRPFMAVAAVWPVVLLIRFTDRVGKGLRSSPRDALIADAVPANRRGAAFALQRMMDHTGAVLGPLLVFVLVRLGGLSVRQVILAAAIPALIVCAIAATLRDHGTLSPAIAVGEPAPSPVRFGRDYAILITAVFVFTLGNSTDAFLLLRMHGAGVDAGTIALLWGAHHVMKIAGAGAGGRASDRAGQKPLMIAGLALYAAAYAAFALVDAGTALAGIFIAYGFSIGVLEPAERSWVAALAPGGKRGTAFGWYHAAVGFGALPASLLFGWLWSTAGKEAAFLTGAGFAAAAALIVLPASNRPRPSSPVNDTA